MGQSWAPVGASSLAHLLSCLALAGCAGCEAPEPVGPPVVIVLVLDGVRVDEFTTRWPSDLTGVSGEEYAEATWSTVVPGSTVVRAARNTGVTVTAPAHAVLVTGREERYANFPLDEGPGLYRPELPTIFEEARAQLGLGITDMVLMGNTELIAGVTSSLYPGFPGGASFDLVGTRDGRPERDDAPVFDALLARLDHDPRLVIVNLHDADRAGHFGEDGEYAANVGKLDELLATFWTTLVEERPELVERLLLIVTADHGRHRHAEHDGWRSHGDSCTGCRDVPLLLVGGARPAQERDDEVTLLDLAPTMAAWLGIELPWADGLPYGEAFDRLDATARAGETRPALAGAHAAFQRWRDDRTARSEVVLDGEVVSSLDAHAAEEPVLHAAGDAAWACFRELDVATGEDFLPWRARCLAHADGAWAEIGFPDAEVGASFRPALRARDGVLWAAWPRNPDGAADIGLNGEVALALAPWTEAGWGAPLTATALYPTDVALAATDRGLLVAVGTNLDPPDARYTRRIRVVPVDLSGEPALDDAVDLTFESVAGPDARIERPALTADGDAVRLAALAHLAEGDTIVVVTESVDGGLSWSDPVVLPDAGPPFPHLGPAWQNDRLVWAVAPEERDGEALLCRAAVGDPEADCVALDSPRVHSFALDGEGVHVALDRGVGAWERVVAAW